MDFKINVEVGVTPQLEKLLARLAAAFAPVGGKNEDAGAVAPAKAEKPAEAKETAKNSAPEAKAKKAEPKEEAEAPKQAPTEFTKQDVRDAMKRCRKRFEGEDYETNTTSEAYKKHHAALSVWFRYLASTSGASDELPSSLTAEQRKGFIKDCDDTILSDEGNFTVPRLIKAKGANK